MQDTPTPSMPLVALLYLNITLYITCLYINRYRYNNIIHLLPWYSELNQSTNEKRDKIYKNLRINNWLLSYIL